jgi:hypothetical protein
MTPETHHVPDPRRRWCTTSPWTVVVNVTDPHVKLYRGAFPEENFSLGVVSSTISPFPTAGQHILGDETVIRMVCDRVFS